MNTEAIKHYKDLTQTVDSSSRNFIESFGLSLFNIRRTYADGSIIWIFNRPSYLEEYCANNIPLPRSHYYEPHHADLDSEGVCLWDDTLPILNISYARERQKAFHGMSFFQETENYCDSVGVSFGREDIIAPSSFYLTIMPELRRFKKKFLHTHEALLDTLYQQKIVLRSAPENTSSLDELRRQYEEKPLIIHYQQRPVTLSVEESLCRYLIKQGKTKYEIAVMLNMSYTPLKVLIDSLRVKEDRPFYQKSEEGFIKMHTSTPNEFETFPSSK